MKTLFIVAVVWVMALCLIAFLIFNDAGRPIDKKKMIKDAFDKAFDNLIYLQTKLNDSDDVKHRIAAKNVFKAIDILLMIEQLIDKEDDGS